MAKEFLTDAELLTKYGLIDPGTDVFRFAQQVRALSDKRRAFLGCSAVCTYGEMVIVIYSIVGTDSQGQAVNASYDTARGALAEMIRTLNRRYAAQMRAQNQ